MPKSSFSVFLCICRIMAASSRLLLFAKTDKRKSSETQIAGVTQIFLQHHRPLSRNMRFRLFAPSTSTHPFFSVNEGAFA
jgi:hypothetical protein